LCDTLLLKLGFGGKVFFFYARRAVEGTKGRNVLPPEKKNLQSDSKITKGRKAAGVLLGKGSQSYRMSIRLMKKKKRVGVAVPTKVNTSLKLNSRADRKEQKACLQIYVNGPWKPKIDGGCEKSAPIIKEGNSEGELERQKSGCKFPSRVRDTRLDPGGETFS